MEELKIYNKTKERDTCNCIACNSNAARIIGRTPVVGNGETDLLLCQECNSVYRWPRPSKESVDDFYKNAGQFNTNPGKYGFWIREKTAKSRIATVASMIKKKGFLLENCLFLDVGAGIGLHCKEAASSGFLNPTGFEPREWACKFGQSKFGITINTSLADNQNLRAVIDAHGNAKSILIFCSHVLEHTVNPESFLKTVMVNSSKSRHVFLALIVPDVNCETYSINGKISCNLWEQHMQSFSCKGLSRLIERSGLRELLIERQENPIRFYGHNIIHYGRNIGKYTGLPFRILGRVINHIGSITANACCTDLPAEIRLCAEIVAENH